jgi:hypothetical protein
VARRTGDISEMRKTLRGGGEAGKYEVTDGQRHDDILI